MNRKQLERDETKMTLIIFDYVKAREIIYEELHRHAIVIYQRIKLEKE
jgi:hypothetical protein